jgi:cytochrome c biogenesis protein CcdA
MGFLSSLFYYCSLFIIPGAILVRKHESFVRRAIGIIVILLGIIPQAIAYLHTLPTRPTGPPIETLAFFFIPCILLILPSRSSQ